MQKLLDIASASEIIGVNMSIVLGWCDNHIINCQLAPKEYLNKTKFLIDAAECEYLNRLIQKYGVRKAFLYYEKNRSELCRSENPIVSDSANDMNTVPKQEESKEILTNNKLLTGCASENSDELMNKVLRARFIKNKIIKHKTELIKLEQQYKELREYISSEI